MILLSCVMERKHIIENTNYLEAEKLESRFGQKGVVLWFTGYSGSGKSSIASAIQRRLFQVGKVSLALDGDKLRKGINCDLGFSTKDREENIRRTSEIASFLVESGMIVLVALISPFEKDRTLARQKVKTDRFIEIYIKASLETCMLRDPKGLYEKATQGKIDNFTGLTSPYEVPKKPELTLNTEELDIDRCSLFVLDYLKLNKFI